MMTDPIIPTLVEWGIPSIPDWRTGPDGQEDPAWRQEWFATRDDLIRVRQAVHSLCHESHPNHRLNRQVELALCAEDPARWLAMWGYIEEPRRRRGEDHVKPFTPFGFQVQLLQWVDWLYALPEDEVADGYISKCRELGASWIICAYALHGWLFKTPWDVLLLSRKEELVDKPKNKKALFYKIDFLLRYLPEWMKPTGYFHGDPWRLSMNLTNPVTGSVIMGESTTEKSGRGARSTMIVYDEAAFMPNFNDVFSTGASVADVRVVISTESFEEGTDFNDTLRVQRELNAARVIDLDWYRNPYMDQAWYDMMKDRMAATPEKFAVEYLRDPWAAYGSLVYPSIGEKKADAEGYIEGQPILAGIDPGFADDTAIVWLQIQPDGFYRVIDSFEDNLKPAEYYAHLLTGIPAEPGDTAYGTPFSARAQRLMEWTRTLPWSERVRYVMDPSGAAKDTSGLSFYERLVLESKKLRKREAERLAEESGETVAPRALLVYYKDLYAKNKHDIRHLAARNMLLRTLIANTDGAKAWQYAMKSYRYTKPGANASGEPKPIHGPESHLASAFEYAATWAELGLGAPKKRTESGDKPLKAGRVSRPDRIPRPARVAA